MYLPQYHIVDIEPTIFCSNANIYIIFLDIQQNHTDMFSYLYLFLDKKDTHAQKNLYTHQVISYS